MISAPPRASSMIESLRGMGYSPGTAIADIADNSIAAGATEIDIRIVDSEAGPSITISDNGRGMTASELQSAMTLGDRSPLDERDPKDLGRFGLGLKTASFSQCRLLTVGTKRNGVISILRWDLDFLASARDGGWYLLEGPRPGSEALLEPLARLDAGTVVVLETLDRMLPSSGDMQELLDVTDQIERHLSMVFHRFLRKGRLSISINGIGIIKPWDPFLSANSFTWHSQEVTFGSHRSSIAAQSFVLPHRDKLSIDEYDAAGGPDGWTSQQGFYVYRNERLLVAGSWLGLGKGKGWTKDEPLRLARIRLDLQNSADADWKIDIRKSTAQPPVHYRKFLTSLAEDARERARKVFAHRGKPTGPLRQPVAQAWKAHHFKDGVRYRIDPDHPAVESVMAAAADYGPAFSRDLKNLLRIIEETVPVQRIWLDTAEEKETPLNHFAGTPSKEVVEAAQILFNSMITRKGMSVELARASLLRTEPFNLFPELVGTLNSN